MTTPQDGKVEFFPPRTSPTQEQIDAVRLWAFLLL